MIGSDTHTSARMRSFIDTHDDWLTVFRLPAYAPELNPAEGVWSHCNRALDNLAVRTIDQLADTIKSRLKRIQYRPGLIEPTPKRGLPVVACSPCGWWTPLA